VEAARVYLLALITDQPAIFLGESPLAGLGDGEPHGV
jgi:hypothetical protein